MTRIIGIDIGANGSGVCALLTEMPKVVSNFKKDKSIKIFKIKPCNESVDLLLELKPDGLVMEPTGGWYSRFWWQFARVFKIECYWVGHADLKATRGHYGFTNKYDDTDAVCLACCYFDPWFTNSRGERRWLKNFNDIALAAVRESFFEVEQLDKVRNAMVNQLRQRLSFEFPEFAGKNFEIGVKGFSPALGWICGKSKWIKHDKLFAETVAKRLGIDLTDYSVKHAEALIEIEKRLTQAELELFLTWNRTEFEPYVDVFQEFGFSFTLIPMMILCCYPLDRYLVDGKIIREYKEGRNGKLYRENISVRQFQGYLGLKRVIEQSGGRTKIEWFGSKMLRAHLYIWARGKFPEDSVSVGDTETGKKFTRKYSDLVKERKAKKDAIFRTLFKMSRNLFMALYHKLY